MDNNAPPPPPPDTPVSIPPPVQPIPEPEAMTSPPTPVLPTSVPPTIPVERSKRKKFLLLGIALFLIVSGVGAIALFIPRLQTVTAPIETHIPTPNKKPDEMSGFTSGIPITENTVQVTKADGKYCLRYKGKVYLPQQQGEYEPKEVFPEDPEIYQWHGLVDPPGDLAIKTTFKDEIFGFKAYPDNSGFMFIMRWPKEKSDHYEVFNFNDNSVSPVASFTPSLQELVYRVPKIYQMSPGGNLVSLHMFDCWECERHYPQTFLLNLSSKQTKVIGQTSYFSWKENGQYEYKDYFVNQDPSTLPLKTGAFNF